MHPIRKARAERGWSATELARRSGVDRSAISGAEGGFRRMRPETLARLAHVLGVPVETLEETFPKGAALGDWREALRALTNAERFNMALAAAPGDAWPGGAALGNLASLKSFTVAYNVSPSQVLAELEATMPGLRETLDRLHRQAEEKAQEYRREAERMAAEAAAQLDDANRRARDAG